MSEEIPYTVRRSRRARYAQLRVTRTGVEVVLPQNAPAEMAGSLLAEKRAWLKRAIAKQDAAGEQVAGRRLYDGGSVPLLGEDLDLRVETAGVRRPTVKFNAGTGLVTVRAQAGDRETLAELLERWYRRIAQDEVALRLDQAVARNGTAYTSLSIRGQQTRWASCSSRGGMSFNWRLMLAPTEVLDYVVEHEAAHLEVRDHSPRFWRLLDQRMPEWQQHRDWLNRHGETLWLT